MGNRIGEPDRKEGSLQSNASGDVEQQFVQARLMAEAGLVRELTPGSSSRQPALSPSRSDAIKDMESSSHEEYEGLFDACQYGNTASVQKWLSEAPLEQIKEAGVHALHIAAAEGNTEIAKALLQAGVTIDEDPQWKHCVPLHEACQHGHTDMVKLLLKHGARQYIEHKDALERTPMSAALKHGHNDIVLELRKSGALFINISQFELYRACEKGDMETVKKYLMNGTKEGLDHTLHIAAQNSHIEKYCEIALEILDAGADPNKCGLPLLDASKNGCLQLVKRLLIHGADPNYSREDGNTPLHLAIRYGHLSCVSELVAKGARVDAVNEDGNTPLHLAIRYRHLSCVSELVAKGARVDAVNEDGDTPLHLAACYGHLFWVSEFVAKGERMDAVNKDGDTPLHLAAHYGCLSCVLELVARGARVDAVNKIGNCPLHEAVSMNRFPNGTVAALLAAPGGSSVVNRPNQMSYTPLHLATQWNRMNEPSVIAELLRYGAQVNVKDQYGYTPLHNAAWRGSREITSLLLAKGGQVDVKNKDNETPLDIAKKCNHSAVLELLSPGAEQSNITEGEDATDPSPAVEEPSATSKFEDADSQLDSLLEKYCHQGMIRHKSLKCLFTGPPRVGKTTLRKRLLKIIKNLISSGVISTSGGLEKPITVIIGEAKECVTVVMDPDYTDWQLQHDLLDEAQLVLQFIDHQFIDQQFIDQQPTPNLESTPEDMMSFEPGTPPDSLTTPSEIHPNPSPSSETEAVSFNDAKKLMQEVLASRGLHSIEDIEKTTTIYLMDTGGQPEFHEIMPIILQGPALHMVFFNLAFNLNEHISVRFCQQDGTNAMITYQSSYTGIQMIYQLLSSLYCLSKDSSMHSQPTAVLIGTHLDQLKDLDEQGEERITEINSSIKQLLTDAEFHKQAFLTYPVQDRSVDNSTLFVPVDNYSGGEEEIEQLQVFLKQVIDNRFDPVELPSAWLFFHLVLRHRYENSPGVCTLQDCVALARGCGLNEDDVPQVLRYIHRHLGTILYYEEVKGLNRLVICDPNVLFRGVFHLVAASFAGDRAYHTSAAEIRKTGEIPVKLLDRINAQPSNSPLTNEHILNLFKHFKILTELHSGEDAAYFMPCLLQPDTSLELSSDSLQALCLPPLLVRFDGNYIPMGVFSAFVVKLSQGLWEPDPACRYRNHISFFTDGLSSVELLVYPAYLEFRIAISDQEEPEEIHQFCLGVRQTVVDTLKSILDLHEHTRKTKFQLGFYCPGSFQTNGQPHFCGCLPSQNHITPKTFTCSKSPRCQNQCRLPQKYTIWFENGKDSTTARDSGHNRQTLDPVNNTPKTARDSVPDYDAVDSTPLSTKALHRVNSEVTAVTDWHSLGIALKLSSSTLEQIGANYKDPARCMTEVLVTWLRQDQTPHSWKSLVSALMSPTVNRTDVAQEIAAVHCKSGSDQLLHFQYQEVDGTQLERCQASKRWKTFILPATSKVYLRFLQPPEESSLRTILDSISTLTTKWFHLGVALGLSYNTLSVIEFDHPGDSRTCLQQMLIAWLNKKDMAVGSQPSWRALVAALSSPLVSRVEIATMIAVAHPATPLH